MDEIREETNSAEAIRQEIKEKRRTYWRGAITGAASVMAVLLIVLLIGIYSGAVVIGGKGVTGGSQTVTASDGDLLSKDVINKLDNLADQINADYYEDVDQEDLINGMYKGLFEGIGDPYSEYYTPEEYEDIIKRQLPEIPDSNILKEPYVRNTAPCIAYAAYKIKGLNPDAYIVTIPSDHFISNDQAYLNDIQEGLSFIEKQKGLLTIGITPTRAETEYGYIQVKSKDNTQKISQVKTFTEKPNQELANMFFDSDEFLWNAGIFIWSVQDIIQEFKTHMFDLHALFNTECKLNTPAEPAFIKSVYGQCHNVSIDVGIMEKSQHVYVLKGNFGWSDVGTWHAFHALCDKDDHNNVTNSDKVVLNDSNDCIVNVPPRKNVVVQGVDNLIIAEKDNYLMICHRKDEDKIKRFEKFFRHKK